jgi:hypothetical protein
MLQLELNLIVGIVVPDGLTTINKTHTSTIKNILRNEFIYLSYSL